MKLIFSVFFILFASVKSVFAQEIPQGPTDSKRFIPAVAQAIEDEIYDLRRESSYFEIDDNPGGDDTPAEISMYVGKDISQTGAGVVLYKDIPVGEVYRYFTVDSSGLVTLSGDPTSNFRPTGGSMLTIFMTDEKVCDFIQHSYKSKFTVNPLASEKRIHDAEVRQLQRIDYSFRLNKGTGRHE